jgi:hypothetical protein
MNGYVGNFNYIHYYESILVSIHIKYLTEELT